jgi:hypothetical protein
MTRNNTSANQALHTAVFHYNIIPLVLSGRYRISYNLHHIIQ